MKVNCIAAEINVIYIIVLVYIHKNNIVFCYTFNIIGYDV